MTDPIHEGVYLLKDPELSPEERSAIEEHVSECRLCQQRLQSWQSVAAELSLHSLEAANGIQVQKTMVRIRTKKALPPYSWNWALGGALALVLLGVGLWRPSFDGETPFIDEIAFLDSSSDAAVLDSENLDDNTLLAWTLEE